MADNPAIPLAFLGVASVLVISGIQGESLGEVLKGEFGKGTKHEFGSPGFGAQGEGEGIQNASSEQAPEPYGAGQTGYVSPIPKGIHVQWDRNDQGVDFDVPPGTPLLAVENGYVEIAHDPSGFGANYPVLHTSNGSSYYYGHSVPAVQNGTRVKRGEVVAHANTHGQGNATVPGWTEFGPWLSNGPTSNGGEKIRAWLMGLPRVSIVT